MKNKVSVFIVEEHHEAYLVWKYAKERGIISRSNNTLLHIDEHSDMATPILNSSLKRLNGDINRIKQFTYQELNIASFIIPAIYEGLFNKVYWVKQKHNKPNSKGAECYVRTISNEGRKLMAGRMSLLLQFPHEYDKLQDEIVPYKFYKQHIDQLTKLKRPVLDIDLDYFSCIQDPSKKKFRIEITRSEYDQFNRQLYHRIKFFDSGKVETKNEDGKYYYQFNNFRDQITSPLKVERNKINERIKSTIRALKERVGLPIIITICRSKFSGFTPRDQWKFIESTLLKELKEIYPVGTTTHISHLQ